jgi:uncharacterized membrane protein YgcG
VAGVNDDAPAVTIWNPRYVWVTLGAVAMIFLAATQALAVTTVMPLVSADLGGAELYAVAFAGTLATSVIGMVAVGAWCDRKDPVLPLTTAVALFVAGLLVAGFAPSMPVLVLGRLLQGLGTGGQTVALYVVVARVFPRPSTGASSPRSPRRGSSRRSSGPSSRGSSRNRPTGAGCSSVWPSSPSSPSPWSIRLHALPLGTAEPHASRSPGDWLSRASSRPAHSG